MTHKDIHMKKILIICAATLLLLAGVSAADSNIKINDITFEIPEKYQGGDLSDDEYEIEDVIKIRCVDDNIVKAMGLWAEENDFREDISIDNHPVRHFTQYSQSLHDNFSHAYFASQESVYEIAWTGGEITKDIKKIIKSTPESDISDDDFYRGLDASYDIYKQQKKEKLNRDGEYNYLEAKYSSQDTPEDDTRFKEILYTYYLNR